MAAAAAAVVTLTAAVTAVTQMAIGTVCDNGGNKTEKLRVADGQGLVLPCPSVMQFIDEQPS